MSDRVAIRVCALYALFGCLWILFSDRLLETLKARDPALPVVVMTGYSTEAEGGAQLPRGIAGYLEKPLVMEDVAQVMGKALSGAR